MEQDEFDTLIPKAVVVAIRVRKHLDAFREHLYTEENAHKIGYGYKLEHGISENAATHLIRDRMYKMGNALMRQAFVTNLAGDPARFGVFVELAERVGEQKVLNEKPLWDAVKNKDYWALHHAFLTSPLLSAYGVGVEGRRRVSYLSRVLVEGEAAI